MRTIKPQRLGVLHRTYEHGGKCWFTPSVMVAFDLLQPEVPLHEALLWRLVGESFGVSDVFDEAMWKTHGEVLVSGNAHPPHDGATACEVRLTYGPEDAPLIDKRLYAIGDRQWGPLGSSKPQPFTSLPVSWSRAFGGPGFSPNPAGRGVRELTAGESISLPNIEDPTQLVRGPEDRPTPAGLAALPLPHRERQRWAGTYDDVWLKTRYPGFPDDIDWRFFCVAPPDQRLATKIRGGERFAIENMHPERSRIEGTVPTLRVRAFVTVVGDEERRLREVTLTADTLHLFPGQDRGVIFYRGFVEVRDDDAADVAELLVAAESHGEAKSIAHYEDVLRRRTEGEFRGLYALADEELLPALPAGTDPMGHADLGADTPAAHPLLQNVRCGVEHQLAENEKRRGPVPDGLQPLTMADAPAAEMPSDTTELVNQVKENRDKVREAQADAKKKAKESEERARTQAAELGVDFDEMMRDAKHAAAGPPTFSAAEQLVRLRELMQLSRNAGVEIPAVTQQLADPDLADKLEEVERAQRDNYRKHAHLFPEAQRLDGDEAMQLRETVRRAYAAGESLGHRDLTGADLSGLDLSGVCLERAFIENANLADTRLAGANMKGVVLARADLSRADLSGADLSHANLGKARLEGATLVDARLEGANLTEADLSGANLSGAVLDEVQLHRAHVRGVRFRNVTGRRLILDELDLSEADFFGARLPDTIVMGSQLDRANFESAELGGACFLGVTAKGACFDDVRAQNLRVVHESDLVAATFRKADLRRANLRGANLRATCFDEARLSGADVSEANLENSSLQCIRARELLAVRTNFDGADLYGADLMSSILQKSNLSAADLTKSNLFRADLAKVRGDDNTTLREANVAQARFVKRGES